jgi:hypothetical protein
MQNDEDEVGMSEGSEESRGAVQDSTEESYKPRPKFDAQRVKVAAGARRWRQKLHRQPEKRSRTDPRML